MFRMHMRPLAVCIAKDCVPARRGDRTPREIAGRNALLYCLGGLCVASMSVAVVWHRESLMVKSDQLIERLAAVFALIILVGGSLLVLAPFTTALLWGAILSFSSWGLYCKLTAALGGRRKWAATLM